MSTQGGKSLPENLCSVFGAKQLASLIEIKSAETPNSEICAQFGVLTEDFEKSGIR